ncbi:dihydrofolate reductase family protein [Leucobacter sp. CSA2]|uniref:Dihydrofolate reductase family protein n=1 Tax=Leucobacter edaphi TaxID=2796472 RepID=A0A934Q9Y4_9MICO|nr:dihydrofolate reductase family protein [Leucobacter edaphi]MBK0420641.1 dihydrofolate reductase family protein [Leucobacter edaphi]
MGRIIYDAAATANGFIADADHSLDWLFAVEGGEAPEEGLLPAEAAVLVEGSRTYEWILAQEGVLERPERWQELYGETPTFVFTSRELPVPAGADVRFLSGEVAAALPQLREAAAGGDIWVVGGGELAGRFLDAGALDLISVSIAPALLEAGAPFLPRRVGADRLRLVSAAQHGQFARLHYEVIPAAG